jgi:hypothetical protein
VTINFVPEGLQWLVLRSRVDEGRGKLKALLARPLPKPSPKDPHRVVKACARQMSQVNRYLGVMENAIVACTDLRLRHPTLKAKLAKLAGACASAGLKGEQRVRKLLGQMSFCCRLVADSEEQTASARKRFGQMADYYETLGTTGSWVGTNIHHPFLDQAADTLPKKKRAERMRKNGRGKAGPRQKRAAP